MKPFRFDYKETIFKTKNKKKCIIYSCIFDIKDRNFSGNVFPFSFLKNFFIFLFSSITFSHTHTHTLSCVSISTSSRNNRITMGFERISKCLLTYLPFSLSTLIYLSIYPSILYLRFVYRCACARTKKISSSICVLWFIKEPYTVLPSIYPVIHLILNRFPIYLLNKTFSSLFTIFKSQWERIVLYCTRVFDAIIIKFPFF